MEKHCEIERRFGKEGNGEPCRQEALKSFIYHSGKRAYEVAFSLSGNGEDAKELVQETLYRVARAWKQYDESRPPGSDGARSREPQEPQVLFLPLMVLTTSSSTVATNLAGCARSRLR